MNADSTATKPTSFLEFEPFQVSPQAMLHGDGLRDLEGRPVRVLSQRDARALVMPMQALVCTAVAELLPKPMADGREAWSVVAQEMLAFLTAKDPEAAVAAAEVFMPILDAALFVAEHTRVPVSHEVAALSALRRVHRIAFYVTDAEADAFEEGIRLRKQARDALQELAAYNAVHGNVGDVAMVMREDEDEDADLLHPFNRPEVNRRIKASTPWPGLLGADLPLYRSVGEAAAHLKFIDLYVSDGEIWMRVHGRIIGLCLAEEGLADLRSMLAGLSGTSDDPDRFPAGPNGRKGCDGWASTTVNGDRWKVRAQGMLARNGAYWWTLRFLRPTPGRAI